MIHYLGTCIAVGIGLGWVVEQGAGEHKKEDRVACGKFPGTKKVCSHVAMCSKGFVQFPGPLHGLIP
jgi:hypothetical protein